MNNVMDREREAQQGTRTYYAGGSGYADRQAYRPAPQNYYAQQGGYNAPVTYGQPRTDYAQRNYMNPYAQSGYASPEAYRGSYDNRYGYEGTPANYRYDYYAPASYADNSKLSMGMDELVKDNVKNKKKLHLNTKAKILIALYFVIIAVVATLILVNVIMGSNAAADAQTDTSAYTSEANVYYRASDGSAMAVGSEQTAAYEYDTQTNWFDELCDWVGKQVD